MFVLGVAVFGGLVGVVLGVVACLVGVLGAAVREGLGPLAAGLAVLLGSLPWP